MKNFTSCTFWHEIVLCSLVAREAELENGILLCILGFIGVGCCLSTREAELGRRRELSKSGVLAGDSFQVNLWGKCGAKTTPPG